jgi:hypothetical protein
MVLIALLDTEACSPAASLSASKKWKAIAPPIIALTGARILVRCLG